MNEVLLTSIKNQLYQRKNRLNKTVSHLENSDHLYDLLFQVDKALERIDNGVYGLCDVCNDPIEEDRLLVDPLLTLCLDHLNKEQRRALEADLEYAARIQRALLPKKDIIVPGWEYTYHYSPAGAVSGDFFDLIPSVHDSVIFVLGDVSGKGISASLMMTHLHAMLHSLVSFDLPVSEILEKANRLFCESAVSANYATMIVGEAFPDGTLEIANAGHNPPFYLKDRDIYAIKATGIPVGLFLDSKYEVRKYCFEKKESLILYTDGYTEAAVNEIEYGEERFLNHLKELKETDTRSLLENLVNEHKKFLDNSIPGDDVTIAVLKRT